jgi:superfamily I DNA and RNA helicase
MFDHPELWLEVGYRIKSGQLRDGETVALERSGDTSPKFLEDHSSLEDLIQFYQFKDEDEQANWLVANIEQNITKEELRHDDIIVINTDPFTTRSKTGPIRKLLYKKKISSHLAGVDTDPDVFFQSGESITFTGIYRAKGNEAGMVYIINAQDCQSSMWNLSTIRNRLFTAMTRSKAWVRVLGRNDNLNLTPCDNPILTPL